MLSIQNPPPDLSCPCEIEQLNSISDTASGVVQSDLLISCPKFTIRDYALSNRRKDIKTNWPFSEKSLHLCLNQGVKDLLPPFQYLDAEKNSSAQQCTIATSLVSMENEYRLIDQASRPTNLLLSVASDDTQPNLTFVHSSPNKSEVVRRFPSRAVEAATSLNHSASKPIKKPPLVSNKVESIMKPLIKKCRKIIKLNNTAADQNKLENNTSNNFFVSETMASKVCPVCKTFTSTSNTTLNAHIDQCLSGESISQWTSDPTLTKSRIKPRRMRSMVEIYETAQHCTIEELERRNGINLSSCLSLPAQDMEVGSVERKRKLPEDFEETENEGAVYVDGSGTKLRILSKLNGLSSLVTPGDDTGPQRYVDGYKSSKLCVAKKKNKFQEKHHKLKIQVTENKKFRSPRHHQNSQINDMQEHTSGPKEHLEVEEAFTTPPQDQVLVKHIKPESVSRRACSKRSIPTMMHDKGDHLHPTWTRNKKLAGVSNVESPRYSYVNGDCGSKSNMPSGTPCASPRLSNPHDDYGRVPSLTKSVRVPEGSEPCYDRNILGKGNQKQSRERDSSVQCKNKDAPRNKIIPMDVTSIRKVKVKKALTRNGSSVGENLNHIPKGYGLSSKSRGISSFSKKLASKLSTPQASANESTFGLKSKILNLKRPHAYLGCESDGEEIVLQTVANTSDNVRLDRRAYKVRRDNGNSKISGKEEILLKKGMKSTTSKHCPPEIDGPNNSYSVTVTVGSHDENVSVQNNVEPCEKDVVLEAPCSNPFFEVSKKNSNPSNVQCHEVAGYLDVQSDSRGYMKFCDKASLETEDARYPIESILNGGEKMFYIDEDGKSILNQNVHMTTELHSNDGSGSYYAEVDLISIPGPPGSFLPSPSSDEIHGNSTPMSSQNQSSENPHEFADRDSTDSPSATLTNSNSDIAISDSSLNFKLPLKNSIQDVMRLNLSNASDGTMANNISLNPYAGGEELDTVEPKVHLLHCDMAAPSRLENAQPCRCSQNDSDVFRSAALNYLDTSLLSWPTMPSVPKSPFNTLVNFNNFRREKNCNLMLNVPSIGHLAEEIHNATEDLRGSIPNNATTNSGVKFNADGESVSPSTSNHVLRLMGKDLMVVNKDETSDPQWTAKESIFIDDCSKSPVDLALDRMHAMGLMNYGRPSVKPALTTSGNSNSCCFQPRTSYSRSLPLEPTASFQVPPMKGVNSSSVNWSAPDATHHMRSTTPQPGGFS